MVGIMNSIPHVSKPSVFDTKNADKAINTALIIYKTATMTATNFMFSRSFYDISNSILTQKTRKGYVY